MPPSLSRLDFDTARHGLDDQPAAEDRLPLGPAGAVILGLSVAAWFLVIQGMRLAASLV